MSLPSIHDDNDAVNAWLRASGFGEDVVASLDGFAGVDVLELSAEDCRDLLGDVHGPSLFTLIRSNVSNHIEAPTLTRPATNASRFDSDSDDDPPVVLGSGKRPSVVREATDADEKKAEAEAAHIAAVHAHAKSQFDVETSDSDLPEDFQSNNGNRSDSGSDISSVDQVEPVERVQTRAAAVSVARYTAGPMAPDDTTTDPDVQKLKEDIEVGLFDQQHMRRAGQVRPSRARALRRDVHMRYDAAQGGRLGAIVYGTPQEAQTVVPIATCVDIIRGIHPKIFTVEPKVLKTLVVETCFTVVAVGSEADGADIVVLNIVASSTRVANTWLQGLQTLLKQSGMPLVISDPPSRITIVQNASIAIPARPEGRIKVGFLFKLGTLLTKVWQERYFQVNGRVLEYFVYQVEARDPFKKAGKIKLTDATVRVYSQEDASAADAVGREAAMSSSSLPVHSERASPNCMFQITRRGKKHTLQAASAEEALEWVTYLQSVIDRTQDEAKLNAAEVPRGEKPPVDGVTMEGYLGKRGGRGLLRGKWQRRFFQSGLFQGVGHQLRYFSVKKQDGVDIFKQTGAIPLDRAVVLAIEPTDTKNFVAGEPMFTVTPLGAKKTYVLRSRTQVEAVSWVDALQLHVASNAKARAASTTSVPDESTGKTKVRSSLKHATAKALCTGYMRKMGGRRSKAFKERWFVLSHDRLQYYRKVADAKPLGYIALFPGTRIFALDSGKCGFSIKPSNKERVYTMECVNEKLKSEWMEAIQAVIDALVMVQRS